MASLARRRLAAVSSHKIDFGQRPKTPAAQPRGRVPRAARLLALAHDIDRRIRGGELRDLAHAAEALGLTRARVTQITNLLLLAPEIQETILGLPLVTGRDELTERMLRPIVAEPNWDQQLGMWRQIDG